MYVNDGRRIERLCMALFHRCRWQEPASRRAGQLLADFLDRTTCGAVVLLGLTLMSRAASTFFTGHKGYSVKLLEVLAQFEQHAFIHGGEILQVAFFLFGFGLVLATVWSRIVLSLVVRPWLLFVFDGLGLVIGAAWGSLLLQIPELTLNAWMNSLREISALTFLAFITLIPSLVFSIMYCEMGSHLPLRERGGRYDRWISIGVPVIGFALMWGAARDFGHFE